MNITHYRDEHVQAVRDFNIRLGLGGHGTRFPEIPVLEQFNHELPGDIHQELFLAVEDQDVRGGYILKHQDFEVRGTTTRIADFQLPLSEGVVDRRFGHLGLDLLVDATRRQPLLYGLGMGGLNEKLPKLLKAAGWRLWLVPFHFKILNAFQFCRHVRLLRRSCFRSLVLDIAAYTGSAPTALMLLQLVQWLFLPRIDTTSYEIERVETFEAWVDRLWESRDCRFDLIAVRTSRHLNRTFPEADPRFVRLKILFRGTPVGWMLLTCNKLQDHRQFGSMRLGCIVDGLVLQRHISPACVLATRLLRKLGADLIVSNQCHVDWTTALAGAGFLQGPSNFAMAVTSRLATLIGLKENGTDYCHLNRGDGDGPINL
jgi:hypothetical protein